MNQLAALQNENSRLSQTEQQKRAKTKLKVWKMYYECNLVQYSLNKNKCGCMYSVSLDLQWMLYKTKQLSKLPTTKACVRPLHASMTWMSIWFISVNEQEAQSHGTLTWTCTRQTGTNKDTECSLLMEIKCFYFMLETTFWIKHSLKFETHKKTAVARVRYKDLHYINQTSCIYSCWLLSESLF